MATSATSGRRRPDGRVRQRTKDETSETVARVHDASVGGQVRRILSGTLWTSRDYWLVASLCLLVDATLTLLIIFAVRFTEIDFQTYMQQTRLFLKGERRYDHITGDTGPCVYPALHLYLCAVLSLLSDAGKQVKYAQFVYALLYLVNQLVTMAIYHAANIPPVLLPVLVLSKRLHSIYVLRLFNDCWAATFMSGTIWAMCSRRNWGLASTLFSLALGVKMNILLYAPAMVVIYLRALGVRSSMIEAVRVVAIQALLGGPFLLHDAKAYFSSAFDLSRAFLYEWTVNWRMVDEDTFSDKRFAFALLSVHLIVVGLWFGRRWTLVARKDGWMWLRGILDEPRGIANRQPSARFIVVSLFTSNLIGMTFARSLHYQFYSWYAQQIPLLVYVSSLPFLVKLALPICIEWAWNIFPSTPLSSGALLASHSILLLGLWNAKQDDAIDDERQQSGKLRDQDLIKPKA